MTNDSGFLTSHQSLSNYSTLANTIKSLSISGKTITYTKGDNTTGTLTTQDNNTWTAMVGATSSSNGSVGYVNAVPPKDGYNTKYLRADGTWQVPPDHTYTVNNATLTIQKNGTTVKTFTANASSNVTANITVPTKTSDLTNDSGFITSDNTKIPLAGSNQISGSLIPSTDNSIDVGSSTKNIKTLYTKGITIDGKTIDTDANDNMTYDGHIVDTIEEQGDGYIRYSNGIQICWTTNDLFSTASYGTWTYPKTFISTPCVLWQAWGQNTGLFDVAGGGLRSASYAEFIPFRTSGGTYAPYGVSGLAIGRWK